MTSCESLTSCYVEYSNTPVIKEITKKKFAKIIEAGLEKIGLSCGLRCISGMVQDASHRHDRVNIAMRN